MGLAGTYLYLDPQIPSASSYRNLRLETPLRVVTRDDRLLGEFGSRRLIPIPLEDVPPLFVKAILDTEDKRFYSHGGIDFVTLVRSIGLLILQPDDIPPGASTITMQLARNISLSLEQTFTRKLKEMLLAVKLERELSKDEILELYLNVIPFGKRAYGIAAAADVYYGTTPDRLTLAQMAMLAGVPQRPTAGNPINGPRWALRRRGTILRNMRANGSIDDAEFATAMASPITASVHRIEPEVDAPHAAEWVREELYRRFGNELYVGGFEIETTLDSRLQNHAAAVLRQGLERFDRDQGYRGPIRRGLPVPEILRTAVPPALIPAEPTAAAETGAAEVDGVAQAPQPAPPLPSVDAEPSADDELDPAPIRAALAAVMPEDLPPSSFDRPALVTSVTAERAQALLRDGTPITLELEALRWARAYVNGNRKGPRVREAGDVLAAGDLIWVRPGEDGAWSLSQQPDIQGALVSLDPRDGRILALVGGYDFRQLQFNHASQARRQPGSSFKPFLYAAALDAGYTPASRFNDAPLVFEDSQLEGAYRPRNSDGDFRGQTRLREALYRSVNLVSMRVLLAVGAGNVLEYAAGLGFDTRSFPRSTQLAVGGGTMGISPLEMAGAYAILANGGFRVEPYLTQAVRITGQESPVLEARPLVACRLCETQQIAAIGDDESLRVDRAPRVMDARINYQLNSILRDVIQRGTGRRARTLQRRDIAGKTGTTNEADVWFSGFTPELVSIVWIGFPDNRALGDNVFGSNTPLPVWIDFMREALADRPETLLPEPPGLVTALIDPDTGEAVRPGTPGAITEIFRADHAPALRKERVLPEVEDIF